MKNKTKTDKYERYTIISFEKEQKDLVGESLFDLSVVSRGNSYTMCKHSKTKASET